MPTKKPEVTNETLAVMLEALSKCGDERHAANIKRMDAMIELEQIRNGRLGKAERAIDRHQWAIGLIGVIALAVLVALLGKYVHP